MTGRVLAASPRSASQTSPGWGFIEQVDDLLFNVARAGDVQEILIGEFYDFPDALSGLAAVSGFHSRSRASSFSAKASTITCFSGN